MKDCTGIEWNNGDPFALGLLKVDCLALGMLTAISNVLAFIGECKSYLFGPADVIWSDLKCAPEDLRVKPIVRGDWLPRRETYTEFAILLSPHVPI